MGNFKELAEKRPTSLSSGKLACFALGYLWWIWKYWSPHHEIYSVQLML